MVAMFVPYVAIPNVVKNICVSLPLITKPILLVSKLGFCS